MNKNDDACDQRDCFNIENYIAIEYEARLISSTQPTIINSADTVKKDEDACNQRDGFNIENNIEIE